MSLPTPSASAAVDIGELIRSRRTIHEFKPQTVAPDLIRTALELARWAPNHHLSEPWRFYQLGPQTANAIAELNATLVEREKGAEAAAAKLKRWRAIPGWLVVTCERSDQALRRREDYAACCCAIQNFMLYLWQHGVGVKWTTGAVTRNAEFYDLIWVDPEAEELVGLLWYGYPAEIPQPGRAPLSDALVELP